jgi:hypothetical protein
MISVKTMQRLLKQQREANADLATKDISMSMIAEAQGVDTLLYDVVMNNLYDPYNYIKVEQIYEVK